MLGHWLWNAEACSLTITPAEGREGQLCKLQRATDYSLERNHDFVTRQGRGLGSYDRYVFAATVGRATGGTIEAPMKEKWLHVSSVLS